MHNITVITYTMTILKHVDVNEGTEGRRNNGLHLSYEVDDINVRGH